MAERIVHRIAPVPFCEGPAEDKHQMVDMYAEPDPDDATALHYVCLVCGNRVDVAVTFTERKKKPEKPEAEEKHGTHGHAATHGHKK